MTPLTQGLRAWEDRLPQSVHTHVLDYSHCFSDHYYYYYHCFLFKRIQVSTDSKQQRPTDLASETPFLYCCAVSLIDQLAEFSCDIGIGVNMCAEK